MRKKMLQKFIIIVLIIVGALVVYKICNHKDNDNVEQDNNNIVEEVEDTIEEIVSVEENKEEIKEEEKKITNILLLGIDKQENVSDTIMIMSINEKNNTLKLVSIMRDIYVYQGENMANKINYAYHYGGVQGSIDTVNSIFNLDIERYVKVDFEELINIIDYLDGIYVNINEAERNYINERCKKSYIKKTGNVKLDGAQALIYSRIRNIDSDFKRTHRQRVVMHGIFNKMNNIGFVRYQKVIYELCKLSETNLSIEEILRLGTVIYNHDDNKLSEFRIPIDGTTSDNNSGVYHLNWNQEENKKALYNFLYN